MAEIPTITINIDLDKKCWRCKKPGAANGGMCLKCVAKMLNTRTIRRLTRKAK